MRTGSWKEHLYLRKPRNEELRNLYSSLHIIHVIKENEGYVDEACSTCEGKEKFIQNCAGKTWKEETTLEAYA